MIEAFWAFPAGLLIATIVSSVGISGGILWMPFLLVVLEMAPEKAVLTSLMIQTVGMASGSAACVRQGSVDFRTALFILSIAIPGIIAGAIISRVITPVHMEMALGVLAMATALVFVLSHQGNADRGKERADPGKAARYLWIAAPVALGNGLLSTGMGEWLIPIMRGKLSLAMHNAIATCLFITFGTCLISTLSHILLGGSASLPIVAWAVPGVIAGGQIGPRVTGRINERLLKEAFIFALTLVGIHLIYNSY